MLGSCCVCCVCVCGLWIHSEPGGYWLLLSCLQVAPHGLDHLGLLVPSWLGEFV